MPPDYRAEGLETRPLLSSLSTSTSERHCHQYTVPREVTGPQYIKSNKIGVHVFQVLKASLGNIKIE